VVTSGQLYAAALTRVEKDLLEGSAG